MEQNQQVEQQQIEKLKAKLAALQGQNQEPETGQTDFPAWSAIPDNDLEVGSSMERVEGQEYLKYWPEYKNRTLGEAREITHLRRITRDSTRGGIERAEAETQLMAIRGRLRGDK